MPYPPCKFETPAETEARHAQLKPEVLAELIELSVSYFHAAFKAETQTTPGRLTKKIRFDRASELLAGTGLPVTEVAHQCDYAEIFHFSRAFKLDRKLSPRAYRRKHAKKKLP